jgi:hypothetical protein
LCFFDGKKYESEHLIKINHPLLEAKNVITFIHQWKDYLILGAHIFASIFFTNFENIK